MPLPNSAPSTHRLTITHRSGSAAATQATTQIMAPAHEVLHRAGVQMQRLHDNAQQANVMRLHRSVPLATLQRLAPEIARSDASVEYAEPDLLLQKQVQPSDPSTLSLWDLSEPTASVNAPADWASSTGTGVVVAVVDTGYQPHAELAANIVAGYDFIGTAAAGNDGDGRDASALDAGDAVVANFCDSGSGAASNSWHGTHVAGTIAALANNALGVAGIAYGANVDLAAPGGDMRSAATNGILSTVNSGSSAPGVDSYAWYQGTLMATPHVVAVAALMIARNNALTVEQVEALLRSSTRAFPVACSGCGTGMADAGLAVAAAPAAPAVVDTTVAEVEPNNTLATAQAVLPATARISGSLSASSDVDNTRVSLPAGKTLTAVLTPNAAANHNLALYSSAGSALASSSSTGLGAADTVVYSNNGTAAATLVLGVRCSRGAQGAYSLQLTQ